MRGVDVILAAAQRRHEDAEVGQNELFGGAATRERTAACRRREPWLPAERLQREFDAIGFFLSGHPLDDYAASLERLKVQRWTRVLQFGEAGRDRGPRRRHGGVARGAAHQDRQQDGHSGILRSRPATTRR